MGFPKKYGSEDDYWPYNIKNILIVFAKNTTNVNSCMPWIYSLLKRYIVETYINIGWDVSEGGLGGSPNPPKTNAFLEWIMLNIDYLFYFCELLSKFS